MKNWYRKTSLSTLTKNASILLLFLSSIVFAQEEKKFRESMVGQTAPEFTIEQFLTGDNTALEKRIVVLDFWATWCGPCIKEFPKFNGFVSAFKNENISFVSVTYEPQSKLDPFLKKYPLKTNIAVDSDWSMFRVYEAYAIPMVVIIDTRTKTILGELHPTDLKEQMLRDLLADKYVSFPQSKMPYYDPEGAEEFFKKSSGMNK